MCRNLHGSGLNSGSNQRDVAFCGPSLTSGLPTKAGKVCEGSLYNWRNQKGNEPCSQGLLIDVSKGVSPTWVLVFAVAPGCPLFSAPGE